MAGTLAQSGRCHQRRRGAAVDRQGGFAAY